MNKRSFNDILKRRGDRMIEAVLFDMDGVLIDSEIYYMQGTFEWMKGLGYQGTMESIFVLIGSTEAKTYEMIYDFLDHRVSLDEIKEENERYFNENPLDYVKILRPEVKKLLIELKSQGKKIAVCSSSPLKFIQEMIDKNQLDDYFDLVVSGEQFVESKPNPEIYLYASSQLKVSPESCLVIEDSSKGIEAARRAGMDVLALVDHRFKLNQEEATKQIDNLTEILEWIEFKG